MSSFGCAASNPNARPLRARRLLGHRNDARIVELFGQGRQPVGQGEGFEVGQYVEYPVVLHC